MKLFNFGFPLINEFSVLLVVGIKLDGFFRFRTWALHSVFSFLEVNGVALFKFNFFIHVELVSDFMALLMNNAVHIISPGRILFFSFMGLVVSFSFYLVGLLVFGTLFFTGFGLMALMDLCI